MRAGKDNANAVKASFLEKRCQLHNCDALEFVQQTLKGKDMGVSVADPRQMLMFNRLRPVRSMRTGVCKDRSKEQTNGVTQKTDSRTGNLVEQTRRQHAVQVEQSCKRWKMRYSKIGQLSMEALESSQDPNPKRAGWAACEQKQDEGCGRDCAGPRPDTCVPGKSDQENSKIR